jgi:hypothetical protein
VFLLVLDAPSNLLPVTADIILQNLLLNFIQGYHASHSGCKEAASAEPKFKFRTDISGFLYSITHEVHILTTYYNQREAGIA